MTERTETDAERVRLPSVARPRVALAFGLVVALVGAGGLIVGSLIPKSAASDALDDTLPATVTAQVETRVVEERVIIQGEVAQGVRTEVRLSGEGEPDQIPYITAGGPSAGQTLTSGSLLLAVAGRPRIAMHLTSPMYRSLRIGDVGADVLAFETALASLVSGDFDVDTTFTENTMLAADELWGDLGYELPTEAGESWLGPTTSTPSTPPSSTPAPTTHSKRVEYPYVDVHEIVQQAGATSTVISTTALGALADPEAPLAVIASGMRSIEGRVTIVHEDRFAVGTQVRVLAPDRPEVIGTVTALEEFELTGGEGEDEEQQGAGRDVSISLPEEWIGMPEGTQVQVSPQSGAEAVLAVPLTAIRDAATNPHVVIGSASRFEAEEHVPVAVLATGDGWAHIDDDCGLVPGDSVRLTP